MAKKLDVLRDTPLQELEAKIVELRAELSKERAQAASGTKAEKPAKIRDTRRHIARILTIINERKIKSMEQNTKGKVTAGVKK
ncbi:50S ribosomal protein L29 [uncultured archaeon]|nr:50S ribosomal protein L29 [uncultured archaeon]